MTLTAAELSAMRDDIETLLPDTCNLLTVTRTVDGKGGWTDAWGTATAGVACRLDATGGREAAAGDALRPYTSWVLTLPHDTTITAQYRVEHGGNTYSVTAVNDDNSWIASKRVSLERVP